MEVVLALFYLGMEEEHIAIRTLPFLFVLLIGAETPAQTFECEKILRFEILRNGETVLEPVLKLTGGAVSSISVNGSNEGKGFVLEVDVAQVDETRYRIQQTFAAENPEISFTSTLDLDSDSMVVDWGVYSIVARLLRCDNTSRFRF